MSTRKTLSRYVNTFFLDQEPTVNNQTIDEQRAGSVANLRPCVSRGVQEPSAVMFAEDGYRATHDLFLECILRQARTTGENYIWDPTSKMNGVAHGRQLAVDALSYMRHGGLRTDTGRLVWAEAVKRFGSAARSLYPYAIPVLDYVAGGGPAAASIELLHDIILTWSSYVDRKRKGTQFSGDSDLSTITITEEWE